MERAYNYGDEFQFVVVQEDTYGTKPEGPLVRLYTEPVNVARNITSYKIKGSTGSKGPIDAERRDSVRGGTAEFTLTMPLIAHSGPDSQAKSPLWLMSACHFQNHSSDVFSYFDTNAPSGDGVDYSFFFGIKSPVTGEDLAFSGSVVKALDFTFTMDEAASITAECQSKSTGLIGQTIAGSLLTSGSANDTSSLDAFTFQVDVNDTGDSDLSVESASLHFAWDEVKKVTPDGHGGYLDKLFIGYDNCTFTFTAVHATQAELMASSAESGQPVKLTITAGPPYATAADFTDIFVRGIIDNIEQVYDGVYRQTVTCTMSKATAATNFAELNLA